MDIFSISLIAFGLAMDAFAVSVTAGVTVERKHLQNALIMSFYFGFFQGVMPVVGWLSGSYFVTYIQSYAPWIIFLLLSFIGIKMICDSRSGCRINRQYSSHYVLLMLALATSIDALAVGFSFSLINVQLVKTVIIIGGITAIISFIGFYIGKIFGCILNTYAEIAGGIVLILIGLKHLIFR